MAHCVPSVKEDVSLGPFKESYLYEVPRREALAGVDGGRRVHVPHGHSATYESRCHVSGVVRWHCCPTVGDDPEPMRGRPLLTPSVAGMRVQSAWHGGVHP